jgi:hypothetical protein
MTPKRLLLPCTSLGCFKRQWSRGLCNTHYYRWWKHGDPEFVQYRQSPAGAPRAFLDAIPATGSGCIHWPYSTNNVGYGQVYIDGRKHLVSRVVCERVHGPPPSASHLAAHSCGRGHTGCVAPWHLSWKMPAGNAEDARQHGTLSCGERHTSAKITEADVREIRTLLGKQTQDAIAARFGVSQGAISKIATSKTWRHLP